MAEPTTEVVDEQELEAGEEHAERPEELDPERAARRAAALAHVRRWGDPVLKTKALPIERFDNELRTEVAAMADIMEDAIGVGLAATQLGTMHRLFVYRVSHDAPLAVVINPEFEWRSKEKETYEEGCLSIPGIVVDVERPVHVRVSGQDEWGDPLLIEASGLEARVIQHEADHLDGVLMLDRASRDQRKEAVRALREAAAGRNGG
jgi:peptide deformylase